MAESVTINRKSYTLEFKRDVLLSLSNNNGNVSRTAKAYSQYGVTRQHVMRWRDQQQDIFLACNITTSSAPLTTPTGMKCPADFSTVLAHKKRRIRGRKALFPDVEDELVAFISEIREKKQAIHQLKLCEKAREVHSRLYNDDHKPFKASLGWCVKFMERNNLSHTTITSVVPPCEQQVSDESEPVDQKIPADVTEPAESIQQPDPVAVTTNMAPEDRHKFWLRKEDPKRHSHCCIVPGCKNRGSMDKLNVEKRSYYLFPSDQDLQARWASAISRPGWTPAWARICSDHFVGGKKTNHPGSCSYIPSIFPTNMTVSSKTSTKDAQTKPQKCKTPTKKMFKRRLIPKKQKKIAEADKKRVTSRYQSLTELPLRQDYNIDQVDRDDAVNLVTRQHPHFGQLATKMDEFRKDGIFCDINLVLPHDGVTLKAHRVVLAASSVYLHDILSTNTKHKRMDEGQSQDSVGDLPITYSTALAVDTLLHYMYTAQLEVTVDTVQQILKLAMLWCMKDAVNLCGSYISENGLDIGHSELIHDSLDIGNCGTVKVEDIKIEYDNGSQLLHECSACKLVFTSHVEMLEHIEVFHSVAYSQSVQKYCDVGCEVQNISNMKTSDKISWQINKDMDYEPYQKIIKLEGECKEMDDMTSLSKDRTDSMAPEGEVRTLTLGISQKGNLCIPNANLPIIGVIHRNSLGSHVAKGVIHRNSLGSQVAKGVIHRNSLGSHVAKGAVHLSSLVSHVAKGDVTHVGNQKSHLISRTKLKNNIFAFIKNAEGTKTAEETESQDVQQTQITSVNQT